MVKSFLLSILLFLSTGLGFELADVRPKGLDQHSDSLEKIEKLLGPHWSLHKFEGHGINGLVAWRMIGSGVSRMQVAIYANGTGDKVWSLRAYQEYRLRKVNVASDADTITLTNYNKRTIASFSISFLDSVDAN